MSQLEAMYSSPAAESRDQSCTSQGAGVRSRAVLVLAATSPSALAASTCTLQGAGGGWGVSSEMMPEEMVVEVAEQG